MSLNCLLGHIGVDIDIYIDIFQCLQDTEK